MIILYYLSGYNRVLDKEYKILDRYAILLEGLSNTPIIRLVLES